MKGSENLLGFVTQCERYLTLGSSHFAMFLRAQAQGCVSPTGEKLALPEELNKVLASGWEWTVVKAEVEEAFPGFPRWAASTLNSVNSNTKVTSELEAMLEIANLLKQGRKLDDSVKAVKEGLPSCGEYMDDIAYFVKLYSGGDGFPVLHLLKDFCFLDGNQISRALRLKSKTFAFRLINHISFCRLKSKHISLYRLKSKKLAIGSSTTLAFLGSNANTLAFIGSNQTYEPSWFQYIPSTMVGPWVV